MELILILVVFALIFLLLPRYLANGERQDFNPTDPLAEAEVYLAYGRTEQAREILTQALQETPNRKDIQARLEAIKSL